METARKLIEDWRIEATTQVVFSASRVQDRLFSLWGEVRDLPIAREVEAWLTLTLTRELFSGDEIVGLLDDVAAALTQPVAQA